VKCGIIPFVKIHSMVSWKW